MNSPKSLSDLHVNPSDYEVDQLNIDHGVFGVISLVHPKNNPDEKIAIKKVNIKSNRDQNFFIREITSIANITHPCIIKLIGFSTIKLEKNDPNDNNEHYIYMPYIPNGNLEKTILKDFNRQEKVLTPTIRSKIIYGIASAMSFLHRMNIIHRDFKPENILLDEKFNPVIADFGLSRIYSNENMTINLGTPYFMAPELFLITDDAEITLKTDVYAFAVTLLRFFTKKFSFFNKKIKSRQNFIDEIIAGNRYVIPNDVPEFYVELIKKCWDQNPNERPSFDDIVNELENNDGFMLPGSDEKEVKEYINYIKHNSSENTPISSERTNSETQEFDFG